MDLILESNRTSSILRSLSEVEVSDLSYEIAPSYPLLAKKYVQIGSNGGTVTGAVNGQEIVFDIPKANLLKDLCLRTTFLTTGASTPAAYPIGLHLFESISLRTQNRTLCTVSDVAMVDRVLNSPDGKKATMIRMALPLIAATDALNSSSTNASATYTPVFNIFSEAIQTALDLAFYEKIQLVCRFNTLARTGAGTDVSAVTLSDVKLWVWTYRPDDKYMTMLRSKNQSPSKPLNMLSWDTFTERLACTSTTTTTIRLQTNYPVFKTFVSVNPVIVAGIAIRPTSFSFKVGGVTLLDVVPNLIGNWEGAKTGSGSMIVGAASAITYDETKGICLDWGMLTQDYTSVSGAVSFSQLNTPEITVVYPTITAASYEIAVSHYYNTIMTLETGGLISISVAS